MRRLFSAVLLSAFLSVTSAFAQEHEEKAASDSALIVFEIGHSDVDLKLGNNEKQISSIYKSLEKAIREGKVEKISIQASASPEGGYEYNMKLSQERANSIVKFLTDKYPLPDRKVEAIAGGVAWDLFRQKVEELEDSVLQNKAEVLRILNDEPELKTVNGRTVTNRQNLLKRLPDYRWLYDNIYPSLRSGVALYLFLYPVPEDQMPQYLAAQEAKRLAEAAAAAQPEPEPEPEPEPQPEPQPEPEPAAPAPAFAMAVKSNLLYDALTVPNLGAEFFIKDGWTIGGMMDLAWWNTKNSHMWLRHFGGEVEARRYFGKLAEEKPFQGHHLGAYATLQEYDYLLAGKLAKAAGITNYEDLTGLGYQSPLSGGAGVSYGFSLPVAKRLNIDFEVALGFLVGKGYEYKTNTVDNSLDKDAANYLEVSQETSQQWYMKNAEGTHTSPFVTPADANGQSTLWWVGPTRVGVTLVYLIGKDNYNRK